MPWDERRKFDISVSYHITYVGRGFPLQLKRIGDNANNQTIRTRFYSKEDKKAENPGKPNKVSLDSLAESLWKVLPVSPKTIQNYRGAYQRNISKSLGARAIDDVSKAEFIQILAPLAPQNQFQTLMTLRVIYREALARELIMESPVASIRAPRIRVKPKKFLTWEEVRDSDFGKYDSHIKFLALHGLRWGEAVALTQEDVRENVVIINKSKYGSTKTVSSERCVPYFGYFKVFPKSRHAIASALAHYGVTIHSLRKTYAYFLKSNGVHVTTAARFMGHSNPMITLKIYTLVRDDEILEVGVKLKERLMNTPL